MSTGLVPDRWQSAASVDSAPNVLRKVLLACGFIAPLVYAAADVLGGLRYQGYSFTSQAVSELMATGAPSESFVDPFFLVFSGLMLVFSIQVWHEGFGQSRALRIAGACLIIYALLGFTGPTLFEMHPRGSGGVNDAPHIVLTAIIVFCQLMAIGASALAFGSRFRAYAFGTIVVVLVFGALSGSAGPKIAAGEPTPGFGTLERICIYTSLLWVSVFSVMLARRTRLADADDELIMVRDNVHGTVAPGFEEVRAEFARNFAERGEIGAAVAAYWRGEKVVDLWGGRRAPDGNDPWNEDTMVVTMSCTKGLSALALAVAHSKDWFDYDAPVARYWPEFAQNGKANITVRQLLGHEAGLVLLDEKLTVDRMRDLDDVSRLLARQKPMWTPGTRHGYHMMSLGLYMQELLRHVDPAGRTLGEFFRDEIAAPLGIDYYIGLPREIPDERIARVQPLSIPRAIFGLRKTPFAMIRKVLRPHSLVVRSFLLSDLDWNDRKALEIELPAGNGVGTARAMACAYSALAEGGGAIGIRPSTFECVTARPVVANPIDEVLGVPSYFSLGFLRDAPNGSLGWGRRAVGAPGAGGSFAFADPDARLGYAYIMNKLDFYLVNDPREKALRDAVYRAIARLGERNDDVNGIVGRDLMLTNA